MNLRLIDTASDEALAIIGPLYEESFRPYERRDWDALVALLNESDMRLASIETDLEHAAGDLHCQQSIGLVIWWELEGWLYLEHFAILPSLRGRQYGSQVIQKLKGMSAKLVLETSLPDSIENERRIRFYERQGLVVNSIPYVQPPYRRGEAPIPMVLLSQPAITDLAEFTHLTDLIRIHVYERFYK